MMKLVVGGAFQGKLDAACNIFKMEKKEFADGAKCAPKEIDSCRGIYNFHEYVKRCLKKGISAEGIVDKIYNSNPDIVIISNEIGYGIVPMDPFERLWREQTGRICCLLAQKADTVVRVVFGIPMYIKGEEK